MSRVCAQGRQRHHVVAIAPCAPDSSAMRFDRLHLFDRWETTSGVRAVTLFSPEFDRSKPILVGSAEQLPIGVKAAMLFEGIETDINRCLWQLSMPTFRADWDESFAPLNVKLESRWVIEESNGEIWSIQKPRLEGVRWSCPSIHVPGGIPRLGRR